jgi:hypothetical protein
LFLPRPLSCRKRPRRNNGNSISPGSTASAQPKKLLHVYHKLCKDKKEPDREPCRQFNLETKDGKDMCRYSDLLNFSVGSIVDLNEDSSIDSFLSGKQISLATNTIEGLDDFELVCFLVISGQ